MTKRRTSTGGIACLAIACVGFLFAPGPATAAPPVGFAETQAFSGLVNPTVVRFAPAPDGRIFVAEKSGLIRVFDNFSDPTPSTFADLRTKVHNYWDRGLLGMALDPNFASNGLVYVNYAHDAEIGDTAPKWGTAGQTGDTCPTPPGPTADGCVISGRISRLNSSGTETVLIEDYCQQYPSHSAGSLEFDSTGALWASGGDGASFTFADYGQDGDPVNPCEDPSDPSAEGGALRSQDLRTSGDPVSLDGTVIRISAATGQGVATNPLAGDPDANARRIVANGLRNPFRFTISPHGEIYVGDVGWGTWEEINRFPLETSTVRNFGWPCYEGDGSGASAIQPDYDAENLAICEDDLYDSPGAVTAPLYAYDHGAAVGSGCEAGGSAIAGLEFYSAGAFPAGYDDALFFADYNRDCIWVMTTGVDGRPDPDSVAPFQSTALNPVNLEVGPDGALYYTNFDGGTIQRIAATGAPLAAIVTSAGGTITYQAAPGQTNSVVVDDPGSTYTFAETPITAGTGCTQTNANLVTCSDSGINDVDMNMGDRGDTADATTVGDDDDFLMNGEGGNDILALSGENDGPETANGGGGNDYLYGGSAGVDDLNGDNGNDRLDGGLGAEDDDYDGGNDLDRVVYGSLDPPGTPNFSYTCTAQPVILDMDNNADDGSCADAGKDTENVRSTVESITGGGGDAADDDVITGSCQANTFVGSALTANGHLDGNDTFNGDSAGCFAATTDGTEADFMGGGEGNDTFNGDGTGNAGFDTVTYGSPYTGHAVSVGAPCAVSGNRAVSVTFDDAGNDCDGFGNTADNVNGDINRLIGSPLADSINGGGPAGPTAADEGLQLFGRLGNDLLVDGPFNDLLNGEGDTDTINCPNGGTDVALNEESGGAGCES